MAKFRIDLGIQPGIADKIDDPALRQVFLYSMFVAAMAFFAKISDPAVGGTYMTFLNTLCNLGGNWPNTVVLWLVDVLTWKQCSNNAENTCLGKEEQQVSALGGFTHLQDTFI